MGWKIYMLVSKIISSIIEIILISSLPFIWWLISAKKKENFFSWIGLKKIENTKTTLINTIIISLVFYDCIYYYSLFDKNHYLHSPAK